jgi:hypothetical protein
MRSIAHFDTSWRICSHSFALDVDESLRMAWNGVKPAAISTSPTKRVVTICRSRAKLIHRDLFIVVPIVGKNFRACVAFDARSLVWPAAENTTAASSIRAFGSSWWIALSQRDVNSSPESFRGINYQRVRRTRSHLILSCRATSPAAP